jgi:thiol-disulfide isomerase/thioredoxin
MKKLMLGLAGVLAVSMMAFAQTTKQETMTKTEGYVTYDAKVFAADTSSKRVLFFAASWCPTCRSADKDINANLKDIPKDVVIYKTDYDTETALKTKYGITRQHTFVYVNAKAEAIKKWSGGGLNEILAVIKAAK